MQKYISTTFEQYKKDLFSLNKNPLNLAEEKVLLLKIKQGDQEAYHELILRNLKFVISIAKKYLSFGISIDDLVSEGNIAILIAAQKFDHNKDVKFITYAVWWIKQFIYKSIAENSSLVRVPQRKNNEMIMIYRALHTKYKCNENIDDKSLEELSHKFKLSKEYIATLYHITKFQFLNIDEYYEGKYTFSKTISPEQTTHLQIESTENNIIHNNYITYIKDEIKKILTPREYIIIKYRYGLDNDGLRETLRSIGKRLNLSRERVRQIERHSIKKLQRKLSYKLELN